MNMQKSNDYLADANHKKCQQPEGRPQNFATNSNSSGSKKSRFEEVEIKLEKMFAGIEDEQCTNLNSKNATSKCETPSKVVTEKQPLQTKAAVKSTDCSIPPQKHIQSHIKEAVVLKGKHDLDVIDEPPLKHSPHVDCAATSAATQFLEARTTKHVPTMVNNDGNGQKSANNSFSKTKMKKKKGSLKVGGQQKLKMRNTCSSSDNDNDADDKYQQCKDMDVKYRSPYVVVKPGGDVSVVNSTTTDDHNDKSMKLKKNHERKNVKGTYSSTLSTKYDADTPDSSWICVFCKRGPHKKGLGDLYGPYIASLDIYKYRTENNIAIGENVKNKIVGGMPGATCPNDPNTSLVRPLAPEAMKSENQLPQGFEPLLGDMKRPLQNGLSNEPQSMEIWFHEDCAIWAPNLFLVGSKLVGLENAIWNSTQHVCVYCNKSGAIVCCLERECKETAHPICAQESNWLLNESKLWAYCIKHY